MLAACLHARARNAENVGPHANRSTAERMAAKLALDVAVTLLFLNENVKVLMFRGLRFAYVVGL